MCKKYIKLIRYLIELTVKGGKSSNSCPLVMINSDPSEKSSFGGAFLMVLGGVNFVNNYFIVPHNI